MNKRNARNLSQRESKKILPNWFIEIEDTTLSILKHNDYNDFKRISTFLKSALSYNVKIDENNEPVDSGIKHIKIEVENKGMFNGYQHFTLIEYVRLSENDFFWKISKSLKAKIRSKLSSE